MRFGFALWIVLVLCVSCGNKQEKVTREQCAKVADHIADLIIDHYAAHPDELWEAVTSQPGETGVPPTVTKETFKAFLDTPEGKTWLMQRHGQARSGTESGIPDCVAKATPKLVSCLLAAKSRDDVTACDQAK
ncbi:MAG TPA: hypothetical protein VFV99_08840 [Kofleriaceae bacterium]|nr:hypothetical protein [Kofleriaceae bacterium]